jgi:hypothetical protein
LSYKSVVTIFLLSLSLADCASKTKGAASLEPSIVVVPFQNRTAEPVLPVMALLKETLIRWNLNLNSDPKQATWVLVGTIDRFDQMPKSIHSDGRVQEYRLTIGISCLLNKVGNAKPVLQWDDIAEADWEVMPDPIQEQVARDRAIRDASWALSQKTASRLRYFLSNKAIPSPKPPH